jgi:hypothetical protein
MKNGFWLLFTTLFITQLSAQDWKALFDGRTLNGWTKRGGEGIFEVKNNEIIGTCQASKGNTFLCTERRDYQNFIFEIEFLNEGGINSGFMFRGQSRPDYMDGRVHGYQCEVDQNDRRWTAAIYDEARRMWITYPNYNDAGRMADKRKTWNKIRIESVGNTTRTFCNGVPVVHLVDTLLEKGFFALQVHTPYSPADIGKTIRFRNIRVLENPKPSDLTPLDDCPINNNTATVSEAEKKQGWKALFNGKNLDGWRSAFKTTAPTEGWLVSDNTLTIKGSDGSESRSFGDLVTIDTFKAFELNFEFRLTEGANSGIKYFVNEKFDTKGGSAIGLEYQILDDEKHPDAKMGAAGNRTLASLYDLIPSYKLEKRFQRPIGAWNQGRIVALPNNIIQHWLNGYKVVEYERKSNIFAALVARSKYEKLEGFGLNSAGPILLQDHGNTVSYRNVRVRSL